MAATCLASPSIRGHKQKLQHYMHHSGQGDVKQTQTASRRHELMDPFALPPLAGNTRHNHGSSVPEVCQGTRQGQRLGPSITVETHLKGLHPGQDDARPTRQPPRLVLDLNDQRVERGARPLGHALSDMMIRGTLIADVEPEGLELAELADGLTELLQHAIRLVGVHNVIEVKL
jgi:hypothetical protein